MYSDQSNNDELGLTGWLFWCERAAVRVVPYTANLNDGGTGFGEFNYAGEACGKIRNPAYYSYRFSFFGFVKDTRQTCLLLLRYVPLSLRNRRWSQNWFLRWMPCHSVNNNSDDIVANRLDTWFKRMYHVRYIWGTIFFYQVSFVPWAKRMAPDMAKGASTRNPQSSLLESCKLPEVFRKRLESF